MRSFFVPLSLRGRSTPMTPYLGLRIQYSIQPCASPICRSRFCLGSGALPTGPWSPRTQGEFSYTQGHEWSCLGFLNCESLFATIPSPCYCVRGGQWPPTSNYLAPQGCTIMQNKGTSGTRTPEKTSSFINFIHRAAVVGLVPIRLNMILFGSINAYLGLGP